MSQPRKHHYLPQFYLRGFSTDQRSIFQIEKTSGQYFGCQIKDTAAIRDFHELDFEDAADPHALEKELADLEGNLAEHLRTFLRDGISNTTALLEVVGLLSLLRMRVPAVKQHIEKSHTAAIKAVAKSMEKAGKLPQPPPGFEEALQIDNLIFSTMNWKCLETMFKMASNPDILNVLCRMRATLYRCPPDQLFITCDQPVSLFHPTINPSGHFGVGPALKGVEITLPLSSSTLIKLDHSTGPNAEATATQDEIIEFNRRTIIMAQKYLFYGEQPDALRPMIARYRYQHAGFEFQEVQFGPQYLQVQKCVPIPPDQPL